MKLTKTQFGKNLLVYAFLAMTVTASVFAFGGNETSTRVTTSPTIAAEDTWIGIIDGAAINMHYDAHANALVGTVKNMTYSDFSNARITVDTVTNSGSASQAATLTLGTPGDLTAEPNDRVVKENTVVFDAQSTVPVYISLNESQGTSVRNGGWQVSFGADNAPKYGLFEHGALLATEGVHLSSTFSKAADGVNTTMEYDVEDEEFTVTLTNYTNMPIHGVQAYIHLGNGTTYGVDHAVNLQAGETKDFVFEVDLVGVNYYVGETIVASL